MVRKKGSPWWQGDHLSAEEVENLPPPEEPLRRIRHVGTLKPEQETDPEKILAHLRSEHHPPGFFSCCAQSYIVADYYKNRKQVEEKVRQLLIRGEVDYVWKTRGDERVCSECRQHEGKIFSLLSPPPEGHPGTKPGCRCEMEVIKGEAPPKKPNW